MVRSIAVIPCKNIISKRKRVKLAKNIFKRTNLIEKTPKSRSIRPRW